MNKKNAVTFRTIPAKKARDKRSCKRVGAGREFEPPLPGQNDKSIASSTNVRDSGLTPRSIKRTINGVGLLWFLVPNESWSSTIICYEETV